MAKKQCNRGHIYDSAIYGDNCPFCPSQGSGETAADGGATGGNFGGETEVNMGGRTQVAGGTQASGPTIPMDSGAGRTIIRPAGGGAVSSGKKLVGLLVTYSTNPNGQVFNIVEGKTLSAGICQLIFVYRTAKYPESIFLSCTAARMVNLNSRMNNRVTVLFLTKF
jgi:hypothetical protein